MSRLGSLLRRMVPQIPARRQISGVNMQMRKQLRRVKKLNTFSRQFTGQQNQNGWFTPKRFRALGQFIETTRNVHPGTLPIKPELKKQIGDKMVQDSHWSYYVYRNYMTQIFEQQKIQKQTVTNEEISQLPAHFRDDIMKKGEQDPLPKLINPNFLYNGQFNICMPMDERYRMNLLLKLDNPPEDKGAQEDAQ